MKYILSMTVFIAAAAISTFGQAAAPQASQCALKMAQAPAIRGIKLGMRIDEVLAMFPGTREDENIRIATSDNQSYPRFGVINFGVAPSAYASKERFAGIGSLYFTFVDGGMVKYEVEYARPPWPRLDDFINKIAAAFQLPQADKWIAENPNRRNLICDGFRMQATTHDSRGFLIVIRGDDPYKIQRDRRAAAEEEERRDFRP